MNNRTQKTFFLHEVFYMDFCHVSTAEKNITSFLQHTTQNINPVSDKQYFSAIQILSYQPTLNMVLGLWTAINCLKIAKETHKSKIVKKLTTKFISFNFFSQKSLFKKISI